MARIYYVHWNEAEAREQATDLEAAGHEVTIHWSSGEQATLKEPLPDALVISLDRLPSHGRAIAEWFWGARHRRAIPIYFVGGAPDKIAATRAKFPAAQFCSRFEIQDRLRAIEE